METIKKVFEMTAEKLKRHFKHLSYTDRIRIETLFNEGRGVNYIARVIKVNAGTISRELKRGAYTRQNRDGTEAAGYSPDIADEKYRAHLKAKGADLKIGKDFAFANFIEDLIVNEHYSPAAALGKIKDEGLKFSASICVTTLYSYIDKEIFLNLTNKSLPVKPRKKKQEYNHVRPKRPPKGESIEKRPNEVNDRETFGDWLGIFAAMKLRQKRA